VRKTLGVMLIVILVSSVIISNLLLAIDPSRNENKFIEYHITENMTVRLPVMINDVSKLKIALMNFINAYITATESGHLNEFLKVFRGYTYTSFLQWDPFKALSYLSTTLPASVEERAGNVSTNLSFLMRIIKDLNAIVNKIDSMGFGNETSGELILEDLYVYIQMSHENIVMGFSPVRTYPLMVLKIAINREIEIPITLLYDRTGDLGTKYLIVSTQKMPDIEDSLVEGIYRLKEVYRNASVSLVVSYGPIYWSEKYNDDVVILYPCYAYKVYPEKSETVFYMLYIWANNTITIRKIMTSFGEPHRANLSSPSVERVLVYDYLTGNVSWIYLSHNERETTKKIIVSILIGAAISGIITVIMLLRSKT